MQNSAINLIVVSPAFNEENLIGKWLEEADQFFFNKSEIFQNVVFVVVDDGSSDSTFDICTKTAVKANFIEVVSLQLSRNFGHQAALLCGLNYAISNLPEADILVTMDSDGEHPFTVIPELFQKWQEGSQLVHTRRKESRGLSFFKRSSSKLFYWLIRKLTDLPIESGMADFKLWDFSLLKNVGPYLADAGALRLFAVFVSPNSAIVDFDQHVISDRISRFSNRKMLSLALQSIVFYSAVPMRLIGAVGGVSILLSLVISAHALLMYFRGATVPGWATVVIAISVYSGAQSFCLYIIAEYLLRFSFRSKLPKYILLKSK